MKHANSSHRPVLILQGSHVFVDVEERMAEELQIHLYSHNVRSLASHHRPGVVRLEVLELPADVLEAIIDEWEVSREA
jgi:hypothetical protein